MIEVRTPTRLHFGLLALSRDAAGRQFGGVGLMIRKPDVLLRVSRADAHEHSGRMGDRAAQFAQRFIQQALEQRLIPAPLAVRVDVQRVPRPHTGLGSGTQLAMAVAHALGHLLELGDLDAPAMAQLVGRGERSAVGAHGFFHGGLIVDGGKTSPHALSPLLVRLAFPTDWRLLLIRPYRLEGIAGARERAAFETLPDFDDRLSARMCQLVLMGLLPAVVERDFQAFGQSLYELQQIVGSCFTPAQGGLYADPFLEALVRHVRAQKIPGVGQSSWGPTLYAITRDRGEAEHLAASLQQQFQLEPGELMVTEADNRGASLRSLTRSS